MVAQLVDGLQVQLHLQPYVSQQKHLSISQSQFSLDLS